MINPGKALYSKGVKGADPNSEYGFLSQSEMTSNHSLGQRGGDYYVKRDYKPEAKMNPELNMLFPASTAASIATCTGSGSISTQCPTSSWA